MLPCRKIVSYLPTPLSMAQCLWLLSLLGEQESVSHVWLPQLVWGLPFHLCLAPPLGSLIEPSVLSLKGPGSVISRYLCELIRYS